MYLADNMIIDGSDGGGQVIRTALALSTITGKPFKAINIRKGRTSPGLKPQHLACIKALEELSLADARHFGIGSTVLEFYPGQIQPQTLSIDIGTAGSITLLLQSLLLPCCLADGKSRLKITGGTDVKWSMPIDFFTNLVLPQFSVLADFRINDLRRGFYPRGQGFFDITIKPKGIKKKINLTKKPLIEKIRGVSSASSGLRAAEVVERQAKSAKAKLKNLDIPVKIVEEYQETASPGTVITLWTETIGSDSLGEPRKRAEAVGAEAGSGLLYLLCSDAVVDSHLADNLIPLIAVCGGEMITEEITKHLQSNAYVCRKFLNKIEIVGNRVSSKTPD